VWRTGVEVRRTVDGGRFGALPHGRRGLVPLVVPLTLVRHHVRMLGVTYLAEQTYLQPHPKELMQHNYV